MGPHLRVDDPLPKSRDGTTERRIIGGLHQRCDALRIGKSRARPPEIPAREFVLATSAVEPAQLQLIADLCEDLARPLDSLEGEIGPPLLQKEISQASLYASF